ncbi:MAG: hypothetical protein CK532_02110 [Flavobacteriales bacterium]|nr:MAG: hypothetical protein CK532_02110 [Flavobacteriales bacterium]
MLRKFWHRYFIVCLLATLCIEGWGQKSDNSPQSNTMLANLLFEQKEFAKAVLFFEDIVETNPDDETSYQRYLRCLVVLNEQEKAIKFIKKRIKKSTRPLPYVIDECWVNTTFPSSNLDKKYAERSQELLNLILEKIRPDANAHLFVSKRFDEHQLKEFAIKTLEQADLVFENIPEISNQLAFLYMETGDRMSGLGEYSNMMIYNGLPFESIKPILEIHITDSIDFIVFQRILIEQIQENPEITALSEGLKWTFIKQENWSSAFLYTRSLDKRLKENGSRVFELGGICISNKAYLVAIQCFEYCVSLGETGFNWLQCQAMLIETKYDYYSSNTASIAEIVDLKTQMTKFEKENGPQEATIPIAIKLATLYAQNDSLFTSKTASGIVTGFDMAEQLLRRYLAGESNPSLGTSKIDPGSNERSSFPYVLKKTATANVKIALGDILLAAGDVWTSELLYAQVEKDFKEEELGQFAKFKRAELSFYRGDFDWASMQLDVLKSATTQLISNDAMELALVIIDNLGIDSNYLALNWYGKALLAEKQHHFKTAFLYLDSINVSFPGHALSDEILFIRARIKETTKNYVEAASLLETLSIAYNFDILADNALYKLGLLYAYKLNDSSKAMERFEKLIETYGSSVYIVDARREYRKIRGY